MFNSIVISHLDPRETPCITVGTAVILCLISTETQVQRATVPVCVLSEMIIAFMLPARPVPGTAFCFTVQKLPVPCVTVSYLYSKINNNNINPNPHTSIFYTGQKLINSLMQL